MFLTVQIASQAVFKTDHGVYLLDGCCINGSGHVCSTHPLQDIGLYNICCGWVSSVLQSQNLTKWWFCRVFTNAYMPVGFEMAVELTYPSDESTTAGILNAMTQAVGVVVTMFLGM